MAVQPSPVSTVGLPAVEATFDATLPFLVACREAVEKLQGALDKLGTSAENRGPLQYAACKQIAPFNVTGTTPGAVPGCALSVQAGGKTYGFRFVVRFFARASNLDLGVVVARPPGPSVVGTVVGRASG